MPRTLKIAAVQMDAAPAPTSERLDRAAALVAEAASAGAQLVVLPEVFNTGYHYSDQNYECAEPLDGPTVTWMKDRAAQHAVHLAGTLLLLDEDQVYNSALLIAPDGRTWRYDKHYPFLWERAYFREGRGITVADTDLGRLGMLICWDAAHASMWERYAGKVDAMVVMSCPPKLSSPELVFPDETRVTYEDLGPGWRAMHADQEYFPDADMDEHAAWLGVPVAHGAAGGRLRTHMPYPRLSLAGWLAARPDLWGAIPQAHDVWLEAGFDRQTKVIDADGQVLARVPDSGDGFTLAAVELADELPRPTGPQPPMRTPKPVYLLADLLGPGLLAPVYQRGLRRQWGARMAPTDPATKAWAALLIGAVLLAFVIGRRGRRRAKLAVGE